ncbi:hypothetical protein B0O99DRAFT_106259 [Bisporella sp. PMI_857]|nr:hypothetical protein B0O99DRAFT_106259 [Bisporella sp. PMI_857]
MIQSVSTTSHYAIEVTQYCDQKNFTPSLQCPSPLVADNILQKLNKWASTKYQPGITKFRSHKCLISQKLVASGIDVVSSKGADQHSA